MKEIRLQITDTGVAAVVVVVVKIGGHAGLRISQIPENRPLAEFE
jgi:hypothetical protein